MRVNRQISASKVLLIDSEGNKIGVVRLEEALKNAADADLDLVEVSNEGVSVCKVMDYKKQQYNHSKKIKQNRKSQKQTRIKIKEIKFKPNISSHDYDFKVKNIRKFVESNCRVKVSCVFRGREIAKKDVGIELLRKVSEQVGDVAVVEGGIQNMNKTLLMILVPLSK